MSTNEFKVLVKALKSVYTSDNFLPSENSIKIWYSLLKDIPYNVLNIAIQKYMMSETYPPTIASLRKLSAELVKGDKPNWSEGWQKVLYALRKYGSYNQGKAMEYLKQDPLTYECVKRLSFYNLCTTTNITVERANFRMIFEELAEKQHERNILSLEINNKIDNLAIEAADELLKLE